MIPLDQDPTRPPNVALRASYGPVFEGSHDDDYRRGWGQIRSSRWGHVELSNRNAAPALLALPGVGTDVAGALLVAAGDNPERLSSEAAFARLCGVAPLPASSGKTNRHRLNRGGDRIANNALWRIVLVRMSSDTKTRNYVDRRTKEGLSKKEIIRCLKRYVARDVYRRLALLSSLLHARGCQPPDRRALGRHTPGI